MIISEEYLYVRQTAYIYAFFSCCLTLRFAYPTFSRQDHKSTIMKKIIMLLAAGLLLNSINLNAQGDVIITNDIDCYMVVHLGDDDCVDGGNPGVYDSPKNTVKTYALSLENIGDPGDIIEIGIMENGTNNNDYIDVDCGDFHNPPYTLINNVCVDPVYVEWTVNGSDFEIDITY